MKILAHTCFIGTTGYNNHARLFFSKLSEFYDIKVRNYTVGKSWNGYSMFPHDGESYITNDMKKILHLQTLHNPDGTRSDYPIYSYDKDFNPDVHIVLMDMNDQYFYEDYDGYKIAYNVWESTRYPDDFFKRLFYFDEVWVASRWQKNNMIEQGFPSEKIFVIPEGINSDYFYPISIPDKRNKFRFLLFGRWEYRKSTLEIIKTFVNTFKGLEDKVELVCSIENPFSNDGFKSSKDRLTHYGINNDNIILLNFPPQDEYLKYLQNGDVFLSCSRSEGWNIPLQEAMSCGIPSIYSNCSGQLEFASGKGIPISIIGLTPANIEKNFPGYYYEPDFDELSTKMFDVYDNYDFYKEKSILESRYVREIFSLDKVVEIGVNNLERIELNLSKKSIIKYTEKNQNKKILFVTAGDINYMPIIEKMVQSLNEFSNQNVIVYGIDCDVPFEFPNLIKKTINPIKYSEHDRWYWKQHACIESLKEDYENFVWIDGDVVANHNIDTIEKYFKDLENYPLSDIHIQDEFFYTYSDGTVQNFDEILIKDWNLVSFSPLMHVCFFIYNKDCKWWFEEIIEKYKSAPLKDYKKLFLWNDEGIDNALRWKYEFKKHLPLLNFDTSSNNQLYDFYKFWNENGPQNFNEIFGYQYIPKDKSQIIYFHGNKDVNKSQMMIDYINLYKNNSFYNSGYFYTDIYNLENLGDIKDIEGSTMFVAEKYGWNRALYHEIFNLKDYYFKKEKRIFNNDIVVDLGGNIGVFSRFAHMEGAGKIITFEPDKRYFKLLKLNVHPNTILFNAAIGDKLDNIELYESNHLGGSSTKYFDDFLNRYYVRQYTLDYLFETKLIDKIDFLKIDIEGNEIEALNGISDENLMKIKNISMEYHNFRYNYDVNLRTKLIERLNNLGFNSYLLFLGQDNKLQMIYFWR